MRFKQTGLSLVELMISVAIGIAMTGITLQIFIDNKQMARVIDANSRVQENGRFALEFLIKDIRQAGYLDSNCFNSNNINNLLNYTTGSANALLYGFTDILNGSDGGAGTDATAGTADDPPDSITLYRISLDTSGSLTADMASASATLTVNPVPNAGDYMLIGDCTSSDLFQVSNIAAGKVVVSNSGGTIGGNSTASLSNAYANGAETYKISIKTIQYTIASGTSGVNALFINENNTGAEELIEGVENMQILYGADTDADNIANYFVPSGTAGLDMKNVVAIKISLLMTSVENGLTLSNQKYNYNGPLPTPTPTTAPDNRIRKIYNTTIMLRNNL